MTTVTVSGFKIRKGERLYGTYVRYALYKATMPSHMIIKSTSDYKLHYRQSCFRHLHSCHIRYNLRCTGEYIFFRNRAKICPGQIFIIM